MEERFYINHNISRGKELNLPEYCNEVFRFHKSLENYAPTPLLENKYLADFLGLSRVYIKDEARRFGTNSFKILGVSYAAHKILKEHNASKIFCTATEGNHGLAVCYTAERLGGQAVIFFPENISLRTKEELRSRATKAFEVNGNYDDAVLSAYQYSQANGCTLIQDTTIDSYRLCPSYIMQGYSTMISEIRDQITFEDIDIVILQAGVGSFAAGVVESILTTSAKRPRLVLVEASEADCFITSMKNQGMTSSKRSGRTIMQGLNCLTPSTLAWPVLKANIDLFMSVTDAEVEDTVQIMSKTPMFETGYSGIAGLAGLLAIARSAELRKAKSFLELNENSKVLVFNTERPNF